jgi:hypothetical protein
MKRNKNTLKILIFTGMLFLANTVMAQEIRVSAAQLRNDYKKNMTDADQKYKNKILVVEECIVDEIKTSHTTLISEDLENSLRHDIECVFQQGETIFKKGQKISIKGICVGRNISWWGIRLENCVVTSVLPIKAVKVSARQLRDDYEENEAFADQKYQYNFLVVEGIVGEIKSNNGSYSKSYYTTLVTEDFVELNVYCFFASDETTDVVKLKKGPDFVNRTPKMILRVRESRI